MSWAGPEDIYLSTSLASYLDSENSLYLCIDFYFVFYLCLIFIFYCQLVGNFTLIVVAEKLLILLRDGRKLMGTLRSFDQFGNSFSNSV